jgi:hypothetical protein
MNSRQNGRITPLLPPQGATYTDESQLFTAPSRQTAAEMEAIMLGSSLIYPLDLNYAERFPHQRVLSNTRANRQDDYTRVFRHMCIYRENDASAGV